ncbi:MAG: ABC transporter permease [Clostridia bacterium]|nr:ABC transporter permease [Clostridia bacterium]
MKKQKSITDILLPLGVFALIAVLWFVITGTEVVPGFLLPSPTKVAIAFVKDIPTIMGHTGYTIAESVIGMGISIVIAFFAAVIMDKFACIKKAFYPLLVVTQTIPAIAIAPILVLWFGFGIAPKVILIVIVCFFPVAVGFLDGFASVDADEIKLLCSMGANNIQIFRHLKLPRSLPHFFAGFKVSSSYCIVSAVISEWLGGTNGLGVYLNRVRSSYDYDKMFAVIILVSVLSLMVMAVISVLEKKLMPYRDK